MFRNRNVTIYKVGGNRPAERTTIFFDNASDNTTDAKIFIFWICIPIFFFFWLWIDTYWTDFNVKSSANACLSGVQYECNKIVQHQVAHESTKKLLRDQIYSLPMSMFGMVILYGMGHRLVYVRRR